MRTFGKLVGWSAGGLMALILIGMVIAGFTSNPDEQVSFSFENIWMVRASVYLVILGCWPLICKYATRIDYNRVSYEDGLKLEEKKNDTYQLLKDQLWKVAAFIMFFEVAMVQQFFFLGN